MNSSTPDAPFIAQAAQAIFQYGPAALVGFAGVTLTSIANAQLKNATRKEERRMLRVILGAVWAATIALIGFAVVQWFQPRRMTFAIRGTIATLQGSEGVSSPLVEQDRRLFTCKVYRPDGLFDIAWLLESDHQLATGEKIQFVIDSGELRAPTYEMAVDPLQYGEVVKIRYYRGRDSLVARFAGRSETLRRIDEEPAAYTPPRRPWLPPLVSDANAAMALRPNDLAIQLESTDPILRRKAWLALAALGPSGVLEASRYLSDPRSSKRLKLGALAGLNSMKGVDDYSGLSQAAIAAIVELGADADAVAAGEARRFMARWPNRRLVAAFEARLSAARSAGHGSTVSVLARSGLDLFHNIGVAEERAYAAPRQDRATRFSQSVAAFRRAWEFRTLAAPADLKYFPKALWGWANMLHDRSWIEKMADGSRDPAKVGAAQAKFRDFVRECGAAGASPTPYSTQVALARNYINNPIPSSLMASR